jgi:hypothetical protein
MGIAGAVGNPGEVAATRGALTGSRENRSAISSETPTICSLNCRQTETRAGGSEVQLGTVVIPTTTAGHQTVRQAVGG